MALYSEEHGQRRSEARSSDGQQEKVGQSLEREVTFFRHRTGGPHKRPPTFRANSKLEQCRLPLQPTVAPLVLVRRAPRLAMRLQDLRRAAKRLHMEEGPVRCAVRAANLRPVVRSLVHGSGKRAAKAIETEIAIMVLLNMVVFPADR